MEDLDKTFNKKDWNKIRVYQALQIACEEEKGKSIRISNQDVIRNGNQCSYGVIKWAKLIEMNTGTLQYVMMCLEDSGIIRRTYDLYDPTFKPEHPDKLNVKKTLITMLINFEYPHQLINHIKQHQRSKGNPHIPSKKYRGLDHMKKKVPYEKALDKVLDHMKKKVPYEKALDIVDSDSKSNILSFSNTHTPTTSYEKEERSDDFFITEASDAYNFSSLSVMKNGASSFSYGPLSGSISATVVSLVASNPTTPIAEMKAMIGALIRLYGYMCTPYGVKSYFYDADNGFFFDVMNDEQSLSDTISVLQAQLYDIKKEHREQERGMGKLERHLGLARMGKVDRIKASPKTDEQKQIEQILKDRSTKKRTPKKRASKPKPKIVDELDPQQVPDSSFETVDSVPVERPKLEDVIAGIQSKRPDLFPTGAVEAVIEPDTVPVDPPEAPTAAVESTEPEPIFRGYVEKPVDLIDADTYQPLDPTTLSVEELQHRSSALYRSSLYYSSQVGFGKTVDLMSQERMRIKERLYVYKPPTLHEQLVA